MAKEQIRKTGFSLAKGKELTGDDFYDVKTIGNLTLAIVCDGVGSATEGAAAAKRVTNYMMNNFKIRPKSWTIEKSILTFIKSINDILYKESQINYESSELVTTLTIVAIEGNRIYGANVGDSRVYLQRDNKLTQLSEDHSMNEKGYENVLTQAIGISQSVEPYYFENTLQKSDKILLCSDGLYNVLDNEALESSINLGAHTLVKKASKLVENDLPDDTTAIVLDILEADDIDILKHQDLLIYQTLKECDVIDGYELKRSLVQNNRTWLVRKKTKEYVLKYAPSECIDDEGVLDLFVKEAWNAKRLKADFFPKAVIPKNRTHRYYVMQLFKGDDLSTYLKDKKLSIEESIKLANMLIDMSQYLLKYDLVHGDIKPANVIVLKNEDGTLEYKSIDFGSITEIFSNNSRAGTPSFLSPERFENESISETSEIFSIGVTLYYALTGKYPYGEIEPFQSPIFKNAKKPSFYNKNIPDWLDSVILRAISIDKEQRYMHYSEMNFELNNPSKVEPYFAKNISYMQRSPTTFYRVGFVSMAIINMILLLYIGYLKS
ncbi:protein phosphatase 2C domain-containing protein [Sulfurimonas sp.]|uniref:protein kinase domain-containing protein n=1 Tax=Sulfurimonas sp. TaxID=2022749 RepID=UPI003566280A